MTKMKLMLVLVLVVALSALVLQNRAAVQVHFLWLTGEMPVVLLLFLTAAGGFVLGVLTSLLLKSRTKPKT